MKNASLLSIGQLCDDECLALFHEKFSWIIKDNKIIIVGRRNLTDKSWDVRFHQHAISSTSSVNSPNFSPLLVNNIITSTSDKQQHTCNYISILDKSKFELAQYLYGCLFAPAIPTVEAAIRNGNLISWPGIDFINFKKYVGTNVAHEKGHLDQERQNLRSTKIAPINNTLSDDIKSEAFPSKVSDK